MTIDEDLDTRLEDTKIDYDRVAGTTHGVLVDESEIFDYYDGVVVLGARIQGEKVAIQGTTRTFNDGPKHADGLRTAIATVAARSGVTVAQLQDAIARNLERQLEENETVNEATVDGGDRC